MYEKAQSSVPRAARPGDQLVPPDTSEMSSQGEAGPLGGGSRGNTLSLGKAKQEVCGLRIRVGWAHFGLGVCSQDMKDQTQPNSYLRTLRSTTPRAHGTPLSPFLQCPCYTCSDMCIRWASGASENLSVDNNTLWGRTEIFSGQNNSLQPTLRSFENSNYSNVMYLSMCICMCECVCEHECLSVRMCV